MATKKKAASKKSKPARFGWFPNPIPFCIEVEHETGSKNQQYPKLSATGNRLPNSLYFLYLALHTSATIQVSGAGSLFIGYNVDPIVLPVDPLTGRTDTLYLNPFADLSGGSINIIWDHKDAKNNVVSSGGGIIIDA